MAEVDAKEVLSKTSKLASYNMILQLSFRLLTFVLNAFVLRFITKEMLGLVNVRLLLLYSTSLFMSREAVRRACISDTTMKTSTVQQTINLVWCILPIGLVNTATMIYLWIYVLQKPIDDDAIHYDTSVFVFGCCAVIELCAEPLWILSQMYMFVKLKVVSEGLAMLAKCAVTVALIIWKPQLGLLNFSAAQVSFSIVYVFVYYGYFVWFVSSGQTKKFDKFPLKSVRDFFPKFSKHDETYAVDINTAKLTLSFFKQSFLKQFLTEGERYVMTVLNVLSFADQGVYDVINNLGSLAARFIFLPIEESFYVFFAKMITRGIPAKLHKPKEQLFMTSNVLFCLLRTVVLIGAIVLAFGVPYSHLLLDVYGGSLLSSGTGPLLLRVYCAYVLLIAVNGTTECFVFAAMNQEEINRYNRKMFVFSFVFLVSSYYFTKAIGSVGFILANCLNMIARILHSLLYIYRFYQGSSIQPNPLRGIVPSKLVIVLLCVSSFVCLASEQVLCCGRGWMFQLVHVTVGAICLALVAAAMWTMETEVVDFVQKQYFFKRTLKVD